MDAVTVHVAIRNLLKEDLKSVLQIEQMSFDDCWTETDFYNAFASGAYGKVAHRNGAIVGYTIYERNKRSIELLSVAVHPWYRRFGISRELVRRVKLELDDRRRHLEATVSERNVDAQLWMRAISFRCIETIHDYFGQYTDGYRFRFEPEWRYGN